MKIILEFENVEEYKEFKKITVQEILSQEQYVIARKVYKKLKKDITSSLSQSVHDIS
ncbi:hypothetical protein L0865_003345 [Clostridioides difficile]|uniref:hypothetical protein n=1 Tax=Clostridioides difficile TaxID=1496 RepID=UPI001304E4AA|nr:hypothetical protein [Clostridioides difficile]EIS9421524.1 hypothetical protein [Clostridioides difficile]EIS9442924.1 hypothetical protein [Clostridioides difficile]EKS7089891.1 hypothetical protein [Clostridioides difficile]MBG0192786.1 hypothetical protein [Clostridioides difficile]MBG0295366.1 hypothetical protein [Clostridioides difficile]